MSTRRKQSGLTTVEFAIIGGLVFMVLFGVIEVGRAMFVLDSLNEATRRSARFATVCPVNDPAIVEVGLFNVPGGGNVSPAVFGLTAANFAVEYLNPNGDPIADPVASFDEIHFVRTRIVNFQHQMLIPFLNLLFTTPQYETTLRRESLGVPRVGPVQPC